MPFIDWEKDSSANLYSMATATHADKVNLTTLLHQYIHLYLTSKKHTN